MADALANVASSQAALVFRAMHVLQDRAKIKTPNPRRTNYEGGEMMYGCKYCFITRGSEVCNCEDKMTHPTQDADMMKALEALDKLRHSANGYNSLLKTGESWDLDKIIRAALTTPATQSEKVEASDVFFEAVHPYRNHDYAMQEAAFCAYLRDNGLKITKEPQRWQQLKREGSSSRSSATPPSVTAPRPPAGVFG